MSTFIGILAICAAGWAVNRASRPADVPRCARKYDSRVIWRDTDARARLRIAQQWEPAQRCVGPWQPDCTAETSRAAREGEA